MFGAALTSFAALLSALQSGHSVRYAALYSNCSLDGGPGVKASGGAAIGAFTISPSGQQLQFQAHELINNYQSASGDFVFDVVTTTVFANGTAIIVASDVPAPDPNSGPPIYRESFTCQLGPGIAFFGAPHRPRALSSFDDVLKASQHGRTLRAVWHDRGRGDTIEGIELQTFESFFDPNPRRFGGTFLASGSASLLQRPSDAQWVVRQTEFKVLPQMNLTLSFADLEPATLTRVAGSPAPFACSPSDWTLFESTP
jgi:hypothetical protein